ncbi:putative zinc finger CCHC domain-containing protein 3-like [Apostichopus japonicus]|nr:putative zinc finger CCHC domain-containing protein 3-like [Apostichopus japonicus]
MAARRDSKIVLLSFSGEAKVVPVQVFSVLRSVGLKVPGEVDALQRKPLRGMNCFDVRFTSEAARVRGVHVLEGVEGLKVTPYDSSVWVTVLHLPLDMSEQVVVRTLGRFGKVTGYEEPEFLECKGVKTGTRRVRIELKSDIPSTLWANGHRAHIAYPGQPRTCWRCGLEGHEARLCPNKRCSRCLQVGHTLAECKGDIVCNSCGKTGHLARLCPDRSYAARVATGVVEAVPVPASDTVPHDAPVIAPVSDTSAPMEALFPLSCPTSPLIELAETASLPTEAEQDKTAEMVLAEWHAAQDAACTGSPVATPAIGDTSRAPSQPAQETLSGPDSDSPMEDCTTALLVVAKESSDWFDETKQATDLIDSSGPSTLPAAASAIPDTMVASGPPVPDREVHSIKVDEELRTLLPRKKRGNTVRGLKRPVLGKFRR